MRLELCAGRGRGQQAHALAPRVVALVDVTPDDHAYVRVSIGDGVKVVGVSQRHCIDPAAAHGHGMVVQADEYLAFARAGERTVEPGELRRTQATVELAGHAAVEHDDAPRAEVV